MSATRTSAGYGWTPFSLAGAVLLAALSFVQSAAAQASAEKFQIGLSTDRIGVGSDFTGARLVVFGALDDADARLMRQQRYDIVIALVGPRRAVVVRQKERTFGLWINRGSEEFSAAPASYAMASTRPLADVASQSILSSFSLGIENLQLNGGPAQTIQARTAATDPDGLPSSAAPDDAEAVGPPSRDAYATALRRIRQSSSLYNQSSSGVQFISRTLFRADLRLPADLPVGRHTVRAYLFKSGAYIRGSERPLVVVKTGFESVIADFAKEQGIVYGFLAVAIAIFTGWFGRVLFKRD